MLNRLTGNGSLVQGTINIFDHILLYFIIFYRILSYYIVFYRILSYVIIFYHILSYFIMFYHILSYFIIFYHIFYWLSGDTHLLFIRPLLLVFRGWIGAANSIISLASLSI